MSLHADLLKQARHLATRERRRPLQASLRRSVSAAYYAMFHLLIAEATNRVVGGATRSALRHCLGRAYGHAEMKAVAQQFATNRVSAKLRPGLGGSVVQPELMRASAAFVDLQQARHEADYDTARRFTRREVLDLVEQAERAFADWRHVRTSLQADTFLVGLLAHRSMKS